MKNLVTTVADRFCSHQPAGILQPFDSSDWEAFAGCESESPEVCYTEEITVVLDGNSIHADVPTGSDERGARRDIYVGHYDDADTARSVALVLIQHPKLASAFLVLAGSF